MNQNNLSILKKFVDNYSTLSPYDFEDMVAELLRTEGWPDVRTTKRSDDRGRDVIGIDLQGNKVFIEVKKHHSNIGRPVVQKLHSAMVTENISKGCIISSSGFSKAAVEYANGVNIELVTGNQFLSRCQHQLSGFTRQSYLCSHILLDSFNQKSAEYVDNIIYAYPKRPSSLKNKIKYDSFTYEPMRIINFNLIQHFSNKSGSFSYDMNFRSAIAGLDINGKYYLWESDPFHKTVDLDIMENHLKKKGIKLQKFAKPNTLSLNELKDLVQNATNKRVIYYGNNNQRYIKELKPSKRNIVINNSRIYWILKAGMKFCYSNKLQLKVSYQDFTVTKLETINHHIDYPYFKRIIMCQDCYHFIHKPTNNRKQRRCRNCGKLICSECVHIKKWFYIFPRWWCSECWKKLEKDAITIKKNYENKRSSREDFRAWKRKKRLLSKVEMIN